MAVIAVTGGFGSGKSSLACYLAAQYAKTRGAPLWANFELQGANPIRSVEALSACRDGVIVFDEFYLLIDSRKIKDNLPFLDWWLQCRKSGCQVIWIAQRFKDVDIRARMTTDYRFECRNLGGDRTEVKKWDLTGEVEKGVGSFCFDRRVSYGLYDSWARAWPLDAGGKRSAPASSGQAGEGGLQHAYA